MPIKYKFFNERIHIIRGGTTGLYRGDLVFIKSVPHLVFEWRKTKEGDVPDRTVALDPARLHVLPENEDYTYDDPITDP
jgi:hypothetical protein